MAVNSAEKFALPGAPASKLLLNILVALKSQDKMNEEYIQILKGAVAKFVQEWVICLKTYENKNPIFWRMHMLLYALMAIVKKTGMNGHYSTEGFENKYHGMNHIKRLMASIAQDSKPRCEKLLQQQQSCLISGFEKVHLFFKAEDYER